VNNALDPLPHYTEYLTVENINHRWENEAVPEVLRCISMPLVKFALSINPGFVFLARVYDLFAA
jgi:hypothetical protein